MWTQQNAALVAILAITCLIPITISGGSYGDHCDKDNSNCTLPSLTCLPSLNCGCSPGFIRQSQDGNHSLCRLPVYNESCDLTTGCQPEFECVNTSGSWRCQCNMAVDFYNSSLGQCVNKPMYGENCDVTIGCVVSNECQEGENKMATCQCNSSDVYLDSVELQCLPMTDLQVHLQSTTVSPTSLTFTWQEQNPDTGLIYRLTWSPPGGRLVYVTTSGAQLSGLEPQTLYNVTITSVLPADPYFPEKTTSVSLADLRTKAVEDNPNYVTNLWLGVGLGVGLTVFASMVVFGLMVYRRRRLRRGHQSRQIQAETVVSEVVGPRDHMNQTPHTQDGDDMDDGPVTYRPSYLEEGSTNYRSSYGTLVLAAPNDDVNQGQTGEEVDMADIIHLIVH